MSKIVAAACENGVVTVEGLEISNVVILSLGVKSSTGVLIIEGEDPPVYVASNAIDIQDAIVKLVAIVDKIASTLNLLGTGFMGSSSAPPPTLGAEVTSIQTLKSQLDAIKDQLR